MERHHLEILGVQPGATRGEIRTAYINRMLESADQMLEDGSYASQVVREAYADCVRDFGSNGHLAHRILRKDLGMMVRCRCGTIYDMGNASECVIECMSCSCSVEIV